MENNNINVVTLKTSSPAGDLIATLPAIRQLWRLTGKKAVIYQALNVVGVGLQGVSQPFTNEDGDSIMMGKDTFTMLLPLIEAQEYIEGFYNYTGQKVDYDLDEMRLKTFTNQPLGSLNRWPFYAFPELACDLSEKWISVGSGPKYVENAIGKYYKAFFEKHLVINFTNRYRNNWINYFFLKQYESKILFVGLPKEHADFCKKWNLEIAHMQLNSFLDLAKCLNLCLGFLGNQSMAYQIAESLKIPRILEVCQLMPNVIPCGPGPAYDFYHQQAVELYVHKLFNS